MTRRATYLRSSAIALTALLGAVSLAACNKSDDSTVAQAGAEPALPLTVSGASPSLAAPSVDALPAARDVSIVRVEDSDDQYAYLDQAYYQSDAFEDAPPDYAFDYDGVRPWVWRSANDAMEFAEPLGDGYRYYYYQPGAAYPYLVRDNGYAYAYDRGQLAVVYDPTGRALSAADMASRRDYAGRYLARADALYQASRKAQRQSVAASNWAAGQARIAAQRAQWSAERSRQNAWRSYDAAHAAQQTAYWQDERERRQQSAQAFSQWRRDDFRGPAPAPAARQQAGRDNQVRQAQAQDEAARRVAADQAQQDRQRQTADQQRQQADQARQQADNQRRADQVRAQADNQRHAQDQQRQQADQARAQADNQRHAQDQARQQAEQKRQQADQARQQADNQRKAEQDRGRQQADQQRQAQQRQAQQRQAQQHQAQQQAGQQRQQAEQQQHQARQQAQQAEQQAKQQAQQAQAQKRQAEQQAQQQAKQAQQQAQQARKDDKPQSRPAAHDEHREKDHKGG